MKKRAKRGEGSVMGQLSVWLKPCPYEPLNAGIFMPIPVPNQERFFISCMT
jgi:hypothetical protein